MTTDSLSWQTGPANSRAVRLLLYLFEGTAGGVLLFFVWQLSGAELWELALLDGSLVVAALALMYFRTEWHSWWTRGMSESRLWQEWLAVRRWRWTAIASVLIGSAYLTVWSRYWWGHLLFSSLYFLVFSSLGLAAFLTVRGTVDPTERTLRVVETGLISARERERTYDLDALAGMRRLSVGGWTLFVFSFTVVPAGGGRRRVVRMPTAVANSTSQIFESALRADGALTAAARSQRTVVRTGILFFLGMGLILLATAYWSGVAIYFTGFVALYISGGLIAILVAYELGFL